MKKELYILLSDTGTWLNKSVKWYTKAPYNHASLSLDRELIELYSFGRKNPKNPVLGGFAKEDVRNGIYTYFPNTTCVLYRLKVTDVEYRKVESVLEAFKKNSDKYTYNAVGLLGVALNRPIEPLNSYFCSQFVAEVLERAGIYLWDKDPALVSPDDFRFSDRLELLYEGSIYQYEPIKLELDNNLIVLKKDYRERLTNYCTENKEYARTKQKIEMFRLVVSSFF